MTKKDAADLESSLLVTKPDDTPRQAMKLSLRKRRTERSPLFGTNSKQRRTCNQKSYESPLIHLGKTNLGNTRSISLDDSVIVLEELRSSPALANTTLSIGEKKQPVCPDDSVIILSDNEGESRTNIKQTNLDIVLEDDSFNGDSEYARMAKVRKVSRRKTIQTRSPCPLICSGGFKTKTIVNRVESPKKKSSMSKLRSKSNMEELQTISIDSEDENTIPNEATSKSNPQAEIITVDNSPSIETNNVSTSTICKPAVDENTEDDEDSLRCTESSSQQATTSGDVSSRGFSVAAEQLASLHFAQEISKRKKFPAFCIDTKGDSSLHRLNSKSIQRRKLQRAKKALQNPNWAKFVKQKCSASLVRESTVPANKPEGNGLGSYYTEETVVKAPGSLRDIVIDGCNIAMSYTNGQYFSEAGLKLVIEYFKLRGHTVKVFIPHHKRCAKHTLLESLHTEGVVVFTPSRRIGGRTISSYEDRYILDYATMCDGIVVSLDQYRDLYNKKPEWQNIIENRLLVPTFVGRCVMFPEDPLGRSGPNLEEFLRH